jgi:hypothetical protein
MPQVQSQERWAPRRKYSNEQNAARLRTRLKNRTGNFYWWIAHHSHTLHQSDFLKGFQEDTIPRNRVEFCVGQLECQRYEVTKMFALQHKAYLAQKFDQLRSTPGWFVRYAFYYFAA